MNLTFKKDIFSISKGMGYDIFWTILGQVVIMIVLLLLNKLLSNYLTVEDFGKYNVIKRSTSVISFVLAGGLGISIPRYLSITISKNNIRGTQAYLVASWIYMLAIILCTSIIYLSFYHSLANVVLGANDFCFYMVCLLYAMTGAINTYIYAYFRGIGKFKSFNVSQIIAQLLLLVPFLFNVINLFWIICFWITLNVIFIFFVFLREYKLYYNIRNKFRIGINEVKVKLKELFIYSFPRLIGDFFLFANSAFPVVYIGHSLGYEQASYYSVGISLVSIVTPVFSFLGIILLPSISKMLANGQISVANKLVTQIAIVYASLAVVLTLCLYFGMDVLIHIFFADKYLAAAKIGKIIVISLLPQSMYYLYRNPNDAASIFPFNTIILIVSFCILVVGFLVFSSISQYANVYLVVSIVQCFLSLIVWYYFSIAKIKK